MKAFKLDFIFDRHHHSASVSVHRGAGHIQYTIAPDDDTLNKRFATQVVHRFGDKLQFAFPGQNKEEEYYNLALSRALRETLHLDN